MRDTRIPRGTSLSDAGQHVEAVASTDTRNKSGYDDFMGRRRVKGYANGFNTLGEALRVALDPTRKRR